VRFVYDNLRKYGYVQRAEIGIGAQEITPTLAARLGLARDWGVLISDVVPGGPAAAARLQLQDIVDAVDERQVSGLAGFAAAMYLHPPDEELTLEVLRGAQRVSVVVPPVQRRDEGYDLADFIDPHNVMEGLGVFMVDLDGRLRRPPAGARRSSGALVIARAPGLSVYTSELRPGDIVYEVNHHPVASIQQVPSLLQPMRPGQAVVLQIERNGELQYIAFEWGD